MSLSLAARLSEVARAWEEGEPITAYRLLARAAPRCAWLQEVVEHLSLDPAPEAHITDPETMRQALEEAAGQAQLTDDPDQTQQLISDLREACIRQPQLSWLGQSIPTPGAADDLDGPITLAVLGEFSSGKSSLINALLGQKILSVGIVPVTTSITRLHYAQDPAAEVVYADGTTRAVDFESLGDFLDERRREDPQSVTPSEVRVGLPVEFLKECEIIDTPGFNSGLRMHDQTAASMVLQADAVIWVFDATQAGKATEWKELEYIRRATGRCFAIMNKTDMLTDDADGVDDLLHHLSGQADSPFERIIPTSAVHIREGTPNTGYESFLGLMQSVRDSSRKIKEQVLHNRRRELARKELARRVLVGCEDEALALEQMERARLTTQLRQDWEDTLHLARRNHEAFEVEPADLTGMGDVVDLLLSITGRGIPANQAEAVLDVWVSAERHSTLIHSSLSDDWAVMHQAVMRFCRIRQAQPTWSTRSSVGRDLYSQYCLLADRVFSPEDSLHELMVHTTDDPATFLNPAPSYQRQAFLYHALARFEQPHMNIRELDDTQLILFYRSRDALIHLHAQLFALGHHACPGTGPWYPCMDPETFRLEFPPIYRAAQDAITRAAPMSRDWRSIPSWVHGFNLMTPHSGLCRKLQQYAWAWVPLALYAVALALIAAFDALAAWALPWQGLSMWWHLALGLPLGVCLLYFIAAVWFCEVETVVFGLLWIPHRIYRLRIQRCIRSQLPVWCQSHWDALQEEGLIPADQQRPAADLGSSLSDPSGEHANAHAALHIRSWIEACRQLQPSAGDTPKPAV